MTMRGVKKPGSQTVTMVSKGIFEKDARLKKTFLDLVR